MRPFLRTAVSLAIATSLFAGGDVTVGDATAAYGKLNTAMLSLASAISASTAAQKKVNSDLKIELNNANAVLKSELQNIEELKTLAGVSSSYVDLIVATQQMYGIQNELDLTRAKELDNIMTKDDIKALKEKW